METASSSTTVACLNSKCGKEIKPTDNFCDKCGHQQKCTECSAKLSLSSLFCNLCGKATAGRDIEEHKMNTFNHTKIVKNADGSNSREIRQSSISNEGLRITRGQFNPMIPESELTPTLIDRNINRDPKHILLSATKSYDDSNKDSDEIVEQVHPFLLKYPTIFREWFDDIDNTIKVVGQLFGGRTKADHCNKLVIALVFYFEHSIKSRIKDRSEITILLKDHQIRDSNFPTYLTRTLKANIAKRGSGWSLNEEGLNSLEKTLEAWNAGEKGLQYWTGSNKSKSKNKKMQNLASESNPLATE
jgi:zinc-ribbon domain